MKTHKGLQWGTAVAVVAFRAMYVSNAVADHTWHHYDGDSQGYHELNPKTEYWRSGEESQVYSSALLESPSMTGSARGGAIDLLRAHDRGTPRTIVGTYTSPTYSGGTGDKSYSTYSERGSAADRSQVSTSGEVIQIPPDVVHIESDLGPSDLARLLTQTGTSLRTSRETTMSGLRRSIVQTAVALH
jgi:hypothetical protein